VAVLPVRDGEVRARPADLDGRRRGGAAEEVARGGDAAERFTGHGLSGAHGGHLLVLSGFCDERTDPQFLYVEVPVSSTVPPFRPVIGCDTAEAGRLGAGRAAELGSGTETVTAVSRPDLVKAEEPSGKGFSWIIGS
jgi:hypothetical protein